MAKWATIWRSSPRCNATPMRASSPSASAAASTTSCSTAWRATAAARWSTSDSRTMAPPRPAASTSACAARGFPISPTIGGGAAGPARPHRARPPPPRRFHERVRSPLLTDIAIDWGGLAVTGVYPARIPDLFAAKPLVVSGRYTSPGAGVIRLRGKMAGRDFTREIRVNLPASQPENAQLATLWARRRVEDLMSQDFGGLQRGALRDDLKQQITKLGIDYRLMTPFTSFVAVEEKVITEGGAPRRVEVPVEMPDGMSYEGVFGRENRLQAS